MDALGQIQFRGLVGTTCKIVSVCGVLFFSQPVGSQHRGSSLYAKTDSEMAREINVSEQEPLQRPANCEDVLLYLDDAIAKTREMKGTSLIVIGRLGKGERPNRLNQLRLHAIENYI